MEQFIKTLLDNYIYLAGIAVFLILALIGYIVDTMKTDKLKKKLLSQSETNSVIPVANLNAGVATNNADGPINNIVNQTTTLNVVDENKAPTENQSTVPPVTLNSENNIQK